ncbi:MAG: S-adenosylmethionine decarboxylase [Gammaproteobacteria bacterium]|nr:S-adenosylmethionine decarboxylase [Gammaproteobacteria bacterium]
MNRNLLLPDAQSDLFYRLKREDGLALAAIRTVRAQKMLAPQHKDIATSSFLGRHMLAEFKIESDSLRFNLLNAPHPEIIIQNIILGAAKAAKATVLKASAFRQAHSGDICAIVVIEESHFSAHYIAKHDFLAIDAFTCGEIDFEKAVSYIRAEVQARPYDEVEFKRGIRDRSDSSFVSGIATQKTASSFCFFKPPVMTSALGQHVVAEFYYCNPALINSADFVVDTFKKGLTLGGCQYHFSYVHEFQPQGISAVVLGDGVHLTVHDWPEFDYASIDLCVFDKNVNLDRVMKHLTDSFQVQHPKCYTFPRGNMKAGTLQPVFESLLQDDSVSSPSLTFRHT